MQNEEVMTDLPQSHWDILGAALVYFLKGLAGVLFGLVAWMSGTAWKDRKRFLECEQLVQEHETRLDEIGEDVENIRKHTIECHENTLLMANDINWIKTGVTEIKQILRDAKL
jgi:hypothetical protein